MLPSDTMTSSTEQLQSIAEYVQRAKEVLWRYEVKSEAILHGVFDSIGVLENDPDTRLDLVRSVQIAQELKRYIDFMEFVNEVLEDMVMDPEAVKRFRELQEDRMLAQRKKAACRV